MNFPQPSWELIEPPHAAQRMAIAQQADYCAKWLRAQGLEVLGVDRGTVLPRIIVRHCGLCDRFEGAVIGYSRNPNGAQRYGFVYRFGCEVRWDIHVEVTA